MCYTGIKPKDKTVTLWFLISLQGSVMLHDGQPSMDFSPGGWLIEANMYNYNIW